MNSCTWIPISSPPSRFPVETLPTKRAHRGIRSQPSRVAPVYGDRVHGRQRHDTVAPVASGPALPRDERRRASRRDRRRQPRRLRGAPRPLPAGGGPAWGGAGRAMLGLARGRLRDHGRAEDAVQDAFASIWRAASTYKPELGPGAPWVYAVARNAIISRGRKRFEPPAELLDEPSMEPGPA